jgi:hypothetical protein
MFIFGKGNEKRKLITTSNDIVASSINNMIKKMKEIGIKNVLRIRKKTFYS